VAEVWRCVGDRGQGAVIRLAPSMVPWMRPAFFNSFRC
jgi:hypothetical protein